VSTPTPGMTDKLEVLFVCVHNAGRSQMAAGLLDHHAHGSVVVRSAGSAPAETINPAVLDVMNELGIDLSKEFPKPLTTEALRASDVVITMGCGDACPISPGKRYLDWELEDPAGKEVHTVRRIRDDIDARVRTLLASGGQHAVQRSLMHISVLARQALAEFLGSAGLVAVVIGSGIAAQRLSPNDTGLQLLENALVTGAGLVALILAFGPVSGGHFNPVVTLTDRVFGGLSNRQVAAHLPAQLAGGALGAITANVMFALPAIEISTRERTSAGLWLSEALATLGLVVLIFGLARSGRGAAAAYAVGAYITAAYFWSSSTSFANPMIDVARMLSNTFAGIAPASVPIFVAMQLLGGALAVGAVAVLYPHVTDAAEEIVIPHTAETHDSATSSSRGSSRSTDSPR
jgi:protein-tyrosine-phosphatase/glycerol uptake facilitator-like aquaporin